MKYIACIDSLGGLGFKGNLLFHIKKDMEHFKELTTGGVVVMGYNTYKSLPHGALPNRLNIVMTKNHTVEEDGVVVVDSHDALFEYLKDNNINKDDVWVIGGARVYVDLLQECKEIYLTRVDALRESDVFFTCPETIAGWDLASIEHNEEDGLEFDFEHFVRRN